ncbi:MAG TPA: choice-of-anchor D domain-containing protein [Polyangiaceae bacterium]
MRDWKRGLCARLFVAGAAALLLAAQCTDAKLAFQSTDTDFGFVAVGSTKTQTVTVTNSGTAEAVLTDIFIQRFGTTAAEPYAVSGGTCVSARRIPAGGSCTIFVSYAPKVTGGTMSAELSVLYNWNDSGVEARAATLGWFRATPIDTVRLSDASGFLPEGLFLWRALGTTTTFPVEVSNYTASEIVLGPVNSTGLGLTAPFSVNGGTCATGLRLASNASCSLGIAFSPTQLGAFESSFALSYTPESTGIAEQTQRVRVSGVGTFPVAIADNLLNVSGVVDLGPLSIGSSVRRVLTVTNWQREAVVLGSSSALHPPFARVGGSCATGTVLQGGGFGNCTLEIAFTPTSLSSVSETLEIPYRTVGASADAVATVLVRGSGAIRDAVTAISIGFGETTCARLASGAVRCWGDNSSGQLGYGNLYNVGDDETPLSRGNVSVGASVLQVATGQHTCAVLEGGAVRCWGRGNEGQLGYGNTASVGDDETPATAGNVSVGGRAVQVALGGSRSCAVLDTGNARCWGNGTSGLLGYGNLRSIGDDEVPASVPVLGLGGPVAELSLGINHTCALLTTGKLRCWGNADAGRLGYGNTDWIGDDEVAGAGGDVDVGGRVVQVSVGSDHTCAVLANGKLRCWGSNRCGALGYPLTVDYVGDDETPAAIGDVPLDAAVQQVASGSCHTCALLTTGAVRCWGDTPFAGALGYPGIWRVSPASAATDVNVGGSVSQLAVSYAHTCALLTTGAVRCWGTSHAGALGHPSFPRIGDDEPPFTALDVAVQ